MRDVTHKWAAWMAALALLTGCPSEPADDDDASGADDDDAGDDDDATDAPPLGEVIGVFNLTNVVQAEGVSYVDFSGGFGTFAEAPDDVLSVAAYLGTFSYGADAPYWRIDLGAYPLPGLGESAVVDMDSYYPFEPSEQTWWDGGPRIGAGNYLTSRLDLEDLSAYQVDDPVSPGADGWTAGGALTWASEEGADVVGFVAEDGIALPESVAIVAPEGAAPEHPAAWDLAVQWTSADDGSFVTVTLIDEETNVAYVAHPPDSGEHVIPADVLQAEFGEGPVELVVARNLQTPLDHPQGNVFVRAREERRVTVTLLPDVVLDPAYGEAGQNMTMNVRWFTADLSGGVTFDGGQSIAVTDTEILSAYEAQLDMKVGPDAGVGARNVTLSTPAGESITLPGGFTVLDLLPIDDCAGADAADALAPGTYTSTTAGLTNDYGSGYACVSWSLNGADAVYRVEVAAGQTLVAALDMPAPGDGALALLTDCDGAESAVACADAGLSGDPETLAWTAEEDGVVYLVVDSWTVGGSGAFSGPWSLELSLDRDVIEPDWIVPGESKSFTLFGEDAWSPDLIAADVDLGDGVGIDAVAPGAEPTELEFLATANEAAVPGPRTIEVTNGAAGLVTFEDALWVTSWPVLDTCSEAEAAAALTPGSATGYAVQTTATLDDVACMPFASAGPEVILPFDFEAGQRMTATATLPTEDAQLYVLSDCNDVTSCFEGAAVDDTLGGEAETITSWEIPETGRYYVVVDVYGGVSDPLTPWEFLLDVAVD